MPQFRGSCWEYAETEKRREDLEPEARAEDKQGHKPINSYKLPSWVQHPDLSEKRAFVIEKTAYVGAAAEGSRNYENWNVAHVAAFHDDLKLLSLATKEQCMEPNRWGMTPAHMCSMGCHPYGAALCVLYELVQMGAADPAAKNFGGATPWHICQRTHTEENLKMFEKVLYKGLKPEMYESRKEAQLKLRGKYARAAGVTLEPSAKPALPVCLVFPGQGSQYVGMLKELSSIDSVKTMLDVAKGILGYDVLQLCLDGPEEKLTQTKHCQPAMFVAGLAAVERLRLDHPDQVERCQAVAGLSLGEYTALCVAGVFDFETGLKLVKARGEAMDAEASGPVEQAMLSVAGLEAEVLQKLCTSCTRPGEVCQVANYLFPKGLAVAGNKRAVDELLPKVQEAGALQAKMLKTSGAFHTPLMAGARKALKAALDEARPKMRPPRCKVYMNLSAKAIDHTTEAAAIVDMMADQLVKPCLWNDSMQAALKDGCTAFVECGPGKQLKAMMKRLRPDIHKEMLNVEA
eukprot:TRINITY_DN100695_c0_g1_i1.p1 TRINITY_DN100695_c0_g1~~TRINITY_DN100695_c0_g1_i1.p1  ORF type:complete len:517 (+),score=163.51 TRINITY_DN100695_c0_g1_i1:108-1658(+)